MRNWNRGGRKGRALQAKRNMMAPKAAVLQPKPKLAPAKSRDFPGYVTPGMLRELAKHFRR